MVCYFFLSLFVPILYFGLMLTGNDRAILSAGPYHDTSEEGKFYAVVLEHGGAGNG